VEVIEGIFYRFIDGNANGITEGFKTSAPYGDVTDSPMENADRITEGFKTTAP